ncbi:hypothetical protein KAJ41_00945 [Candidatus Parcubacteria bacterium]|nr:hypothetical protein [Candidatus Parcubacteria bacterium]
MNKEITDIFDQIRTFKIQGATIIAKNIIDSLTGHIDDIAEASKDRDEFIARIKNIARKLAVVQPIESMAQNIIGFIIFELQDPSINDIEDCKKTMRKSTFSLNRTIAENEKKFIENGTDLVRSITKKTRPLNIFTHCYSSGVRNILEKINNRNIDIKVFNIETRPVFQGRMTAKKMSDIGINVTMCLDSATPFLISKKSGSNIDVILIGADSVSLSGSVVNKSGGYGMALSAFSEQIPVYIVASLLKIKKGTTSFVDIPVETKPFREIWPEAPIGVDIMNLAFDVIPPEFITGFITEFGILKPEEIKDTVIEHYPRLI